MALVDLGILAWKRDMMDELRSWAIDITRYGSCDIGNLAFTQEIRCAA